VGLAAGEGNVGMVTETYEQIISFAPRNINHRIAYAHALTQAREYERAQEVVEELLDDEQAPAVRARLLHLRGDLAWRRGNTEVAEEAYRDCLGLGVPSDSRRLLEVKLDALSRAPQSGREQAFEYLLGEASNGVSLYYPMHWHHQHDDDALAAYLVGRRLWAEQLWERAIPYLEQANAGLTDGILSQEALRMLGATAYFLDRLDQAEQTFEKLRASEHPAYRASAREWLARIAWKRGNRIGTQ
jgi:tetratricopeptide (TPR) repeat protein